MLLSTVDWALIETWKDAGIPLEAVLRGIDEAFDKYDQRVRKTQKINSLAYCAQAVLTAAEDMNEAAVGATRTEPKAAEGLGAAELAEFFSRNAELLRKSDAPAQVRSVAQECAQVLTDLSGAFTSGGATGRLEDLERRMTVLEEKLIAALVISAPESQVTALRAQAEREIAPYRNKMPSAQIDQLLKQFVHKRLLEQAKIPRLSLFYM